MQQLNATQMASGSRGLAGKSTCILALKQRRPSCCNPTKGFAVHIVQQGRFMTDPLTLRPPCLPARVAVTAAS